MTYNVFSGTLDPAQSVCHQLCENDWTDQDVVWTLECWVGCVQEPVLHRNVDASMGTGTCECLADWKALDWCNGAAF